MTFYNIHFSPTGGTKRVADALSNQLSDNAVTIDLCNRNTDLRAFSFVQEDVCIVAVPSYGGRIPATAAQRLCQLQGNGAKAVPVAVYGNREYEDTLIELKDILDAAGFVSIAAVSAVAEHSIVRQFAAGRPDAADIQELKQFADTIKGRLDTGSLPELKVPGNRPYKEFKGLPMHPSGDSRCVKCGICVQSCPVGAISAENMRKTDPGKCICCMRCIAVCPQNARSLNPLVLAGAAKMLKKSCSGRKNNQLI